MKHKKGNKKSIYLPKRTKYSSKNNSHTILRTAHRNRTLLTLNTTAIQRKAREDPDSLIIKVECSCLILN